MSKVYDGKEHAANVRKALEDGFLDSIGEDNLTQALQSEVEEIIASYGTYLIEQTQEVLKNKKLVASSDLKDSASFDSEIKGNDVTTLRFYLAEHWVNVHYGQKRSRTSGAKAPPVKALMEWITTKGIKVRQNNSQSTQSVMEQRKRMAFAIRNTIWNRDYSIKRFRQPGSKFIDEVLTQESLDSLAELLGEVSATVVSYDLLSKFTGKIAL